MHIIVSEIPNIGRTSQSSKLLKVYVKHLCNKEAQSIDRTYIPISSISSMHSIHNMLLNTELTGHDSVK